MTALERMEREWDDIHREMMDLREQVARLKSDVR